MDVTLGGVIIESYIMEKTTFLLSLSTVIQYYFVSSAFFFWTKHLVDVMLHSVILILLSSRVHLEVRVCLGAFERNAQPQ